jgi:NAD(P)-dependent dehydrogenase (short-subunit alcohol dehydrogenase family)
MSTPSRPNGRVALVTGAARGIGLGIAAWLICEGWQVVLTDLDRQRGSKVAKALGDNAWFIAMDVPTRPGQCRVSEVLGAVRSAGCVGVQCGDCQSAQPDAGKPEPGVVESGAGGQPQRADAAGQALRAVPARAQRAIVNLTSTRARQSEPDTEAYAASKGGLVALTHALAMSLGRRFASMR